MPSNPADIRRERIRRSALWAAYGDALGFITEGVDVAGVRRRAGADAVKQTVPWKRKVGGRMGATAELPAGCISDDTQLRLATSRSIRGRGEFDVETFAKIELTVWPSYALGAGVGSQHAAANLRRRNATWDTNFFEDENCSYMRAGGNGAAMRIQPHVWAHPSDGDTRGLVATVVRNAVTTHGHPRGILGAVFHALCLRYTLASGEAPEPLVWLDIASEMENVAMIIREDPALSELWIGQWEMRSSQPFDEAATEVVEEVREDIERCRQLDLLGPENAYAEAVAALDTLRADQRGSGTKTAILAAVLSWLYGPNVIGAVETAANFLHSDTDTIATMVGAISGAIAESEPEGPLCDRDYIAYEADRMATIATGGSAPAFRYPSLVAWTAPRSASDCVGTVEGDVSLAGLGPGELSGAEFEGGGRHTAVWEWLELWFGQRVLAKRKPRPGTLPSSQAMGSAPQYLEAPTRSEPVPLGDDEPTQLRPQQQSFEELGEPVNVPLVEDPGPHEPTIHELTREAIASGFDGELMGRTMRHLMDRDDGIEASIAYSSILAKAWISRRSSSG
jgi:ADP-ribosylglycohydrolase